MIQNEPLIGIFFLGFYGFFAFVGLLNLLLMRRACVPTAGDDGLLPKLTILIPARDEEANLERLVPTILGRGSEGTTPPRIVVFDDESNDATAEVAARNGATVIKPAKPLPAGWTGKNRACHELAKYAIETNETEWVLFLDADVYPEPGFVAAVQKLILQVNPDTAVISGFPRVMPGIGMQPVFLAWVGWILLTTNPYGVVSRTGKGHNRFTNGQFGCWKLSTYAELMPNEALKGQILEDVKIGRLCAKKGVGVEVVNLSAILGVKMYHTWQETLDGMSKNSYEITGSTVGSLAVVALFVAIAWGWLFAGHYWWAAFTLFLLSGLCCCLIARARPYGVFLLPIAITIGAFTILRSMTWHKKGQVKWKGRTYGS